MRLQAAYAIAKHYRDALLPLQQTVVSETQKFYNGMLLGAYDLLLARQTQVQTARDYVAASKDFWLAWADLERAVGGRVPLPAARAAASAGQSDASSRREPRHGDH